jgi:hypothetical protein
MVVGTGHLGRRRDRGRGARPLSVLRWHRPFVLQSRSISRSTLFTSFIGSLIRQRWRSRKEQVLRGGITETRMEGAGVGNWGGQTREQGRRRQRGDLKMAAAIL